MIRDEKFTVTNKDGNGSTLVFYYEEADDIKLEVDMLLRLIHSELRPYYIDLGKLYREGYGKGVEIDEEHEDILKWFNVHAMGVQRHPYGYDLDNLYNDYYLGIINEDNKTRHHFIKTLLDRVNMIDKYFFCKNFEMETMKDDNKDSDVDSSENSLFVSIP